MPFMFLSYSLPLRKVSSYIYIRKYIKDLMTSNTIKPEEPEEEVEETKFSNKNNQQNTFKSEEEIEE